MLRGGFLADHRQLLRRRGPDGFSIEADTCVVDGVSESPGFHFVCVGGQAFYATVVEGAAKRTLTFTAEQNTDWTETGPMVLHRCSDLP